MKILTSEDRVLCLAAVMKYQAHLNEIEDMTRRGSAPVANHRSIDPQMKDEFQSLQAEEYKRAALMARREMGEDVSLPPVLRDWLSLTQRAQS